MNSRAPSSCRAFVPSVALHEQKTHNDGGAQDDTCNFLCELAAHWLSERDCCATDECDCSPDDGQDFEVRATLSELSCKNVAHRATSSDAMVVGERAN